ncbi:MAG: hypothetical protein Q4615_02975 [Paracoccus aminovorans]|nr:hypothetical protein [Paracoccus aminovorans]
MPAQALVAADLAPPDQKALHPPIIAAFAHIDLATDPDDVKALADLLQRQHLSIELRSRISRAGASDPFLMPVRMRQIGDVALGSEQREETWAIRRDFWLFNHRDILNAQGEIAKKPLFAGLVSVFILKHARGGLIDGLIVVFVKHCRNHQRIGRGCSSTGKHDRRHLKHQSCWPTLRIGTSVPKPPCPPSG